MEDLSTKKVVGFAFNDFDFSDRILRLEIIPTVHADHSNEFECCDGAKVVTLRISSHILASKSPFFYKLFKNGMRESQQQNDVSLRINASEEVAFIDLLNFMYANTLSATSAPDLINVLIIADKFEVTSCMKHSVTLLLNLPMSLEDAHLYLELPSSVLVSEIVQPLIDAAKQNVFACFKDFNKCKEDAMELPLCKLETVLGSEGLQVTSEDDVFDFILEWARAHYPKPDERREILTKRLGRFICFPNMSNSKLKEVLVCPEFDHEQASKLVVEALFSKVELSCGQHIHISLGSKDLSTTKCGFLGRVYRPRCVVYFDLKKDQLSESLYPLYSETFYLGERKFYLGVGRWRGYYDKFSLAVHTIKDTKTCTLDFEVALMKKSSKEFESKRKVNNHKLKEDGVMLSNLLRISWTEFMSDKCDYFIDGILHLRAEITLVDNSRR